MRIHIKSGDSHKPRNRSGTEDQKGTKKLTPKENPEDKADRDERARRGGTVPPSSLGAALGPIENTGRQRCTTLTNTASGGIGGGAPPQKPKKSAAVGTPDDSSDNWDSDLGDKEGELPKKKLTSNQPFHKTDRWWWSLLGSLPMLR